MTSHIFFQIKEFLQLLCDDWKLLYPDSNETVFSFLVRLKHLKSQKEIVMKYLRESGFFSYKASDKNNIPNTKELTNLDYRGYYHL